MNKGTRNKQNRKKILTGGQFVISPQIPLIPTSSVSVNLPMMDPIFGTPGYIQGPPINLNPYKQKKFTIGTPGANINFYGNSQQLLNLMDNISQNQNDNYSLTSPCPDDKGYEQVTNKDISSVIKELQSTIDNKRFIKCPPGFQQNTDQSITNGWSVMQDETSNKYFLVSNINGNIKYYSGAGIMLFERLYVNSISGREEPAVILFRSSLTGEYEELGGGIEPEDFNSENTLIITAKREAKEESYNLFDFDRVDYSSTYGGINRYYDREVGTNTYRCYAICLAENQGNDQWKQMYETNKTLINSKSTPSSWRETNDMQRFFISDLQSCLSTKKRGSITTIDASGAVRTIAGRTKACLRYMLQGYTSSSIIDAALSNARSVITIKNDILSNTHQPFLVDTFSIIAS